MFSGWTEVDKGDLFNYVKNHSKFGNININYPKFLKRNTHMNTNSACMYCAKDQRLTDLMIEICQLETSTLYLFKEQTYKGRCLIAYNKDHKEEIFELSDAERALFINDVSKVAKAIKEAFNADKINYGAYGDKMPHLHFHLVPKQEDAPKWGGTFDMMPDEKIYFSAEEYAQVINAIKEKLA
jgi:diadenosine tetraphosphate (Ap4A) HIT family hydrolase